MGQKSYFVDNENETVYELSASYTKKLIKKYPDWYSYNCEFNKEELLEVEQFFHKYGKLVASPQMKNLFLGLVI